MVFCVVHLLLLVAFSYSLAVQSVFPSKKIYNYPLKIGQLHNLLLSRSALVNIFIRMSQMISGSETLDF